MNLESCDIQDSSCINIKNGEIMDTKIDQLKQIIPEKYILRQEPMKNHTTFRNWGTR